MAARRDEDDGALARTCAVTRTVRPVDELIRFVRAPDGTVVPDLKRRLPGRGVWVGAERTLVEQAVRRKVFGRGFKAEVVVAADLAARVGDELGRAALAMLSLANKAGRVVTGFAKVEAALRGGDAVAVVHAAEAGADGVKKLEAAMYRGGVAATVISAFGGERLDLALGRSNVVHAALLAGPVSDAFLARAAWLGRYTGTGQGEPGRRDDHTGQPAGTDTE